MRESSFQRLAHMLVYLAGDEHVVHQTVELLCGKVPHPTVAQLDTQQALLKAHFDALGAALARLPDDALALLDHATAEQTELHPAPDTGDNRVIDRLAWNLLTCLPHWPEEARTLAISLGRLIEDSHRLHPKARSHLSPGRGFEPLFEARLRSRFALLPHRLHYLTALQRHLLLLMEEPDVALHTLEQALQQTFTTTERTWLTLERRSATLRFVRQNKTEDGHIRWFVRPDPAHGAVLDRLGVQGHWLISGNAPPSALARVGTAVERVSGSSASRTATDWHMVIVGAPAAPDLPNTNHSTTTQPVIQHVCTLPPAVLDETDPTRLRQQLRRHLQIEPPLSTPHNTAAPLNLCQHSATPPATSYANRSMYHFELTTTDSDLQLTTFYQGIPQTTLARISFTATEEEILDFLDTVDRVADLAIPLERYDASAEAQPVVAWTRVLLRMRVERSTVLPPPFAALRIRLVYLPSDIPHQLGGVPEVGLQFLLDRLEQSGAAVSIVRLPRAEYAQRLVELLGADVIGIGVYIHNREAAAELVTRLRQAGYQGKIILGGPEVRNIDSIQSSIDGWDAIIRGEAEEVLPEVIRILTLFAQGEVAAALARSRLLQGVVLRYGQAVLLCDTAMRNRAEHILCPLPFDWGRARPERHLKMNFTRGCPYLCVFCPNHQGRRFRSGTASELWRYTVLAIADDLPLPPDTQQQVAAVLQHRLATPTPPPLRIGLALWVRARLTAQNIAELFSTLEAVIDARLVADAARLNAIIGLEETLHDYLSHLGTDGVSRWQAKAAWLLAKVAILASRQLWRQEGRATPPDAPSLDTPTQPERPPFVLETSEDNTLVNRTAILDYLERRKRYGLSVDFIFNPGQNTIRDLTNKRGQADEYYLELLVDNNPFGVALGADGTSNPVIRQNRKPLYGVKEIVAVNKALGQRGIVAANNYILLTPETTLLEAVEAFLLFLLLPIPWRDYAAAINLRVIKEETTLSTDEGLLFDPHDEGYDVPLRCAEVQHLLDRWSLTSLVTTDAIRPLLWRILEEDTAVAALLPLVVERWEYDCDNDPELVALARLIRLHQHPEEPLISTIRRVHTTIHTRALVDGRTVATLQELLHGT